MRDAMSIRILPADLANQIAAGEVVERPASVVKELLENAIDAGATKISIEVEMGGKKLIKMADNGQGMSPEDAALAFERHATSKISKLEDLTAIQTLGFRGEALPSIASIAQVRLSTSSHAGAVGTEVTIAGGGRPSLREIAFHQGTTVEVSQLFYNTPARKKFLKGDGTEATHITRVVQQQALVHPHIQFSLTHNNRTVIQTLPTDQVLYRIAELFGPDITRELVRVEKQDGAYRLEGYISSPIYTRSNRNTQYCFVNDRYVRDKVLLSSTQQGYSHLLPRGQHPVLFLFISMAPDLLDVNVHPAKAEVRFAFQQEVFQFVSRAVQDALRQNEKSSPFLAQKNTSPENFRDDALPAGGGAPSHPSMDHASHSRPARGVGQQVHGDRHAEGLETFYGKSSGRESFGGQETGLPPQVAIFDQKPQAVSELIYSEFNPVGQLENSFILMEGPRGLLVVDQHVAHERVLYERFRQAAQNKNVEVQSLMFPLAVEFSPAEAEALSQSLEALKVLGLELEPFGNHGFLLRSVPAILKNHQHEEILRNIAETLSRDDSHNALQDKLDDVVIMMSCRNAIMVNHPMELDQIKKLLYDLEQTEMPYTCPHGRPIALFFDLNDILRKFKRK